MSGNVTNSSDEFAVRSGKLQTIESLGILRYAQGYAQTHFSSEIISSVKGKNLRLLADIGTTPTKEFSVAGRIMLKRPMGKNMFLQLQDGSGTIQLMFSRDVSKISLKNGDTASTLGEMSAIKFAEKLLDMGDHIGVNGELFMTQSGEPTILVNELTLLSKTLRPLPEKYAGLADQESIYRQRYLDTTTNPESRERFLLRSKFIKAMRDFYETHGFIELDTPILGNAASGAAAKPFITHHNDFDNEVFLRISPETALKKATAGGFERVYEIARNFRNEGSDPSHLQEFTMVEHYAAYWTYKDNMRFIQKMVPHLLQKVGKPTIIPIEDRDGTIQNVDFGSTWEQLDYCAEIKQKSGIDISEYKVGDESRMREAIKATGTQIESIDTLSLAVMTDYLYKKLVRPFIVGPAILSNYPKFMQPLARVSDDNPNMVEQFQVVVNGWEIIKAYGELVDPIDQRERFAQQQKAIAEGDEEATPADFDFLEAMEYGMPPQSGLGFGIDRFLALITGQKNLRDVVLFPLMKPKPIE